MTTIKKVAVAGASGNLGPSIVNALLAANFTVTALTRESSKSTFPSNVHVSRVDFTSVSSLTKALSGQDAVVSVLGSNAVGEQSPLIEAAIASNVQRFIPSEFGSDTTNSKVHALPVFGGKIAAQDILIKEAERNGGKGLSYTLVQTGPFLDWGIKMGFLIDPKGKVAKIYDGGERVFSSTTLEAIGKAVAGVLLKPEETKNRAVFVQSAAMTQKDLRRYTQKATGGAEGWTDQEAKVDDVLKGALEEGKKEDMDMMKWFAGQVFACVWGEGYGGHFQKLDNDLLGVQQLNEAEVQEMVNKLVKENQ